MVGLSDDSFDGDIDIIKLGISDGNEDSAVVGNKLCIWLGIEVGWLLGIELASDVGEVLGMELGCVVSGILYLELGCSDPKTVGDILCIWLGSKEFKRRLGCEVGRVLVSRLFENVGKELSCLLGFEDNLLLGVILAIGVGI